MEPSTAKPEESGQLISDHMDRQAKKQLTYVVDGGICRVGGKCSKAEENDILVHCRSAGEACTHAIRARMPLTDTRDMLKCFNINTLRSWRRATGDSKKRIQLEQETAIKGVCKAFASVLPVAALDASRFPVMAEEYWSVAPAMIDLDDHCRKSRWHPVTRIDCTLLHGLEV